MRVNASRRFVSSVSNGTAMPPDGGAVGGRAESDMAASSRVAKPVRRPCWSQGRVADLGDEANGPATDRLVRWRARLAAPRPADGTLHKVPQVQQSACCTAFVGG